MSFLIYTESFDDLPVSIKEHVYQRFVEILSGRDHSAAYKPLAPANRQVVLQILEATKPDFAQTLTLREDRS
jgi:hypothetical protein